MLYFVSSNLTRLIFQSAGQFKTDEAFIHTRRNLDSFVLLMGSKGTLYIAQDSKRYELGPDQYLLLFPGREHYGYLTCEPGLSYYWCHFTVATNYELCNDDAISQRLFMMRQNNSAENSKDVYLIPEFGTMTSAERANLLFRQLIDLSLKDNYSESMPDYALSLLAMEITQEFIDNKKLGEGMIQPHYSIIEIMEWIRINCAGRLTVKQVSDTFGYNPNYLTTVFKRFTGLPLLKYINKMRMSAAKQMLLNSTDSIKKIAGSIGFDDEKHFMKLFRQFENMTPTQYRNVYYRKHINKN